MSLVCAPFYVMVSEVQVYRSHVVDLNFSRSLHTCNKCNLTGINNCPSEIHSSQCQSSVQSNKVIPYNEQRSIPVSLPQSLPLSSSASSRLSKSIHHYKVTHSQQSNDDSPKSFSSATATILPKTNIIQEKTHVDFNYEENKTSDPSTLSKSTTKTHIPPKTTTKTTIPKSKDIPQFYFPRGKPKSNEEIAAMLKSFNEKLKTIEGKEGIHKSNVEEVAKILKIPIYWKHLIFLNCGGNENNLYITRENIISLWQKIITSSHTAASKFFYLVTQNKKQTIEPQDFYPLVQDVLETHPGLTFLLSARDFHSRYIATVVYRIFFGVNSSWSGRITLSEIERSDLLPVIASLEATDDINTVTQYFSYEHFYVIYCKFWELDDDHDLVISKADLARHNNYAISERMIERIFSGAVTKSRARAEGLMTYTEFVWFLLAEEDKRHPRSIEYWFRCMDLDGDGILSLYELEYFYQEQLFRMEEMGIEPISFEDCLCQMLDMVNPREPNKIRLADLKACRLVPIFFDTFFNLTKYLEHEQRDPFTNLKDLEEGLNEVSDWDRYAAEAYEILVAEDGSQENYNDNFRENGASYKRNDSNEEDVVYENLNSGAAGTGSLNQSKSINNSSTSGNNSGSNKVYESSKYNEYVNGKLADMVDGSGNNAGIKSGSGNASSDNNDNSIKKSNSSID